MRNAILAVVLTAVAAPHAVARGPSLWPLALEALRVAPKLFEDYQNASRAAYQRELAEQRLISERLANDLKRVDLDKQRIYARSMVDTRFYQPLSEARERVAVAEQRYESEIAKRSFYDYEADRYSYSFKYQVEQLQEKRSERDRAEEALLRSARSLADIESRHAYLTRKSLAARSAYAEFLESEPQALVSIHAQAELDRARGRAAVRRDVERRTSNWARSVAMGGRPDVGMMQAQMYMRRKHGDEWAEYETELNRERALSELGQTRRRLKREEASSQLQLVPLDGSLRYARIAYELRSQKAVELAAEVKEIEAYVAEVKGKADENLLKSKHIKPKIAALYLALSSRKAELQKVEQDKAARIRAVSGGTG